ncbi:MAG: restriction endonuclease subunit S, partial [Slackia isoflavoniconvertens]|nr:restriction endonuclease subunit S [Slackia isoflavoniconvertens]
MKAEDLKNSILQMAVEGKLVPQDPSDEPASVLLERIRKEKHRLIAEGKAKFPKGGESVIYIGSDGSPYEKRVDAKGRVLSDECIADQVPFEELPEGWAWVRLSSLFTKIGSGSTPAGGRKVYQNEGPMLIRSQNVHNGGLRLDDVAHFARSLFEKRSSHILPNDMLLNITGASIGRCAIVPGAFGDADVNQHVLIMRPIDKAINRFLHAAIISPVVQMAIMADQVGATKEGLSAAKAANLLAPIPPLAEQRRIVERAEELSALIEEYGRLEDAREELDAVLPGRLRKSVLQMAVQGKLVPQNPVDEPASALLERIRKQRRQLVAEKKMKAPKGGESVVFRGSDGRRPPDIV